jgi:hypothetical protein
MYFEYVCEKCNFGSNVKIAYEVHLKTVKHITGKRKIRCDKKISDKCPDCEYTTKCYMAMMTHILNKHASTKERKEKFKYYCECCNFGTFKMNQYDKHMLSSSHMRMIKKE